MVSFGGIDPTKPIGYQIISRLSDEAQSLFPDLRLNRQEREWCNRTPAELTGEAEWNQYSIKKFRKKLKCCIVVDGLLKGEPETVKQGIEKISTHLTGGPLDKFFFSQAHQIRINVKLQKRIQPVMDALIEAACGDLKRYVDHGRPEILDNHYRNFHVYAATVCRLSPALAPALQREFSRILGSRKNELSPCLLLVSLPAMGYLSGQITEWDEQYVRLWHCDPGSPEGWARGVNNAAYNAPPSVGWDLLKMHPNEVDCFLRKHRSRILTSLVLEMHRKCTCDPSVNAAWLAARFLKLHLTLHVLSGNHAYKQLPSGLAPRVLRIAETVRGAMRRSTDNFDGRLEVEKIAGAVIAFLASQ